MFEFVFHVPNHLCAALVITHGLTDACSAKCIARYALGVAAPIPDEAVTPLFFLASVPT